MTGDGPLQEVDVETVREWLDDGRAVLIDVRERQEYAAESIPGAMLLPLSEFQDRVPFPITAPVAVFHCRSGARTTNYSPLLRTIGFESSYQMKGGIIAWREAGLPTEPGDPKP